MSFDIDPKDNYKRYLINHSESDSLFEVFSQGEAEYLMSQEPCDDVTDIPEWEAKFKAMSLKSEGA